MSTFSCLAHLVAGIGQDQLPAARRTQHRPLPTPSPGTESTQCTIGSSPAPPGQRGSQTPPQAALCPSLLPEGGGLSIHPPAPRARSWHGARYQRVCHIGPFPAVAAKLSHTEEGQKLASPSGRGRSRWLPVALSVSGTVALISF